MIKLIENYFRGRDDTDALNKLDEVTKGQVQTIKQQLLKRGKVWVDDEVIEIVQEQDGWEVDNISSSGWRFTKEMENMVATLTVYLTVIDHEPMAPSDPLKIKDVKLEVDEW